MSPHVVAVLTSAVALFAVWVLNGLWHGSGWNYLFFGMYHFTFIFVANLFEPLTVKSLNVVGIKRDSQWFTCLRIVKTGIIVAFGELFFRAETLTDGIGMFKRIFTDFSLQSMVEVGNRQLGIDNHDIMIIFFALLIVFTISLAQERKVDLRSGLESKNLFARWTLYYGLILFIVIFGAYGVGYIPVDPIYANF